MASTKPLNLPPIYSKAYHLSLECLKLSATLPKPYRPTLGRRLEDNALDLLLKLRVSLLKPRGRIDRNTLDHVDHLKVVLNIIFDLKLMGHAPYQEASKTLAELGRVLSKFFASDETSHAADG